MWKPRASHPASLPGISRQLLHLFNLVKALSSSAISGVNDKKSLQMKDLFLAFVLGGPGSGKGTQCQKIVETFGFMHLSAGDLLRKEISSNTENGLMILNMIKEGNIVPSDITVKLIQREIESSGHHKFLIDGFPRSDENRIGFEMIMGRGPDLVLFFDCPEEEMVKRVLNRNQGRIDDNVETIKKRLLVFHDSNLPVIQYYSQKGILYQISSIGAAEEVFEQVKSIISCYGVTNLQKHWHSQETD